RAGGIRTHNCRFRGPGMTLARMPMDSSRSVGTVRSMSDLHLRIEEANRRRAGQRRSPLSFPPGILDEAAGSGVEPDGLHTSSRVTPQDRKTPAGFGGESVFRS